MARMRKTRTGGIAAAIAVAAIAAGCADDRGPYPGLPPLGARFEFLSKNLCGEGISPEIRLGGVPSNTATYRLRITNTTVLSTQRWEGTIKAESPLIPAGAIADFDAPCPPETQTVGYRLEVMAVAIDGRPLAYGWQFATARSLTRQIEQEQAELKRQPAERPDRTLFPPPVHPRFYVQ